MQKIRFRNLQSLDRLDTPSSDILLQDLLPADLKLEKNEEFRTLSLLNMQNFRILVQQRFTKNEWLLLTQLFMYYPHYVPHEMLLAELTLLSSADCRQQLQKARVRGQHAVVQELKPVYRALSGVRIKLKKLNLGLKISLVRNCGYAVTLTREDEAWSKPN